MAHRGLPHSSDDLSPRMVLVFAITCGVVVANLYYAQPLLATIARDFHQSSGTVGLVATLTQVGYAVGLALIVPLGDLLDRRRLVVTVLVGTTLALLAALLAPSITVLMGAALAIGLTSVVAQVLVPFAASLANDAERGRVVGIVMSGLLVGILLARTVAGLIGQAGGWRAVYGVAALLMLGLIAVLHRELPAGRQRQAVNLSYRQLLASLGTIAREEPVLRRRAAYGALLFAAFNVFWTNMAFLLARPPYGYNEAVIGLFGLAGIAGALCASTAGRLADRGFARFTTGGFAFVTLAAFGLLGLGGRQLLPLVAGIVLLDLGVQGMQITNQSEIYRLQAAARSRLTTVYMTTYFVGGAVGSATSAAAFARAGWPAVCALGAAYAGVVCAAWAVEICRH